MKKSFYVRLAFFLFAGMLNAKEIHVSKSGNDNNAGTQANPYLTVSKAANVAIAGDVVIIHEGTYEEILQPSNSGSSGNPITFKGADGEKVIISAMQAISGWSHDADNVYKAYVDWDLGQDNMVLHGDKLMDLARWPNNTGESPFPLTYNVMTSGGENYIDYSPGIPDWNWSNGGSMHFYGAAGFLAWKEYITSTTSTRVYFDLVRNEDWIPEKHNPGYTGHGVYDGEFYLQGIREALDYKNEWYYNSDSKTLYAQIDGGGQPLDGAVMMRKRTETINLIKNYIHIEDLAVFGGSIEMIGNYNKLYRVSCFYGNNTLGVINSFDSGRQSVYVDGNNCTVEKCEIAYGAGNGLRDRGDGNQILNNYIHHFNFLGNYDCVLNTRGATNSKYIGNSLEYGGRDIIQAYGDGCEYAYNEVAWSNIVADDCALLYTTNTRSSTSTIHHNWFHDAASKGERFKAAGIYLDNSSKNWDVHHNIVSNTEWTNIQINWDGTNLNIFNNTLVNGSATMGAWYNGYEQSNVKVWNNITEKEASDRPGNQEDEHTWEPTADTQNNLVSESSFSDLDNNDFTLKAGAEAIDYGRVINLDGINYTEGYVGASPDAGAYEYGATPWTAGVDWDVNLGPTATGCYGLPGESCTGEKVDVTGISVAQEQVALEVGDVLGLVANVLPSDASNKTVSWSIDDPTVASLTAGGSLKGLKAGVAIATATTAEGNYAVNCTITVTPSTKTEYELEAIHDAYLQGTTLFNTGDLRVESGNRVSYLMFDLSQISNEITGLTLDLAVGSDAGNGEVTVNLGLHNNWTETTLSSANAPAAGVQLATVSETYALSNSYSWTLDESSISGGDMLTLVVTHVSGNDVSFASSEYSNAALQPILRVVTKVESVDPENPIEAVAMTIEAEDYEATGGDIDDASFNNTVSGYGVKDNGNIMNWVNNGDWAEYTLEVTATANYDLTYLIASPNDGTLIKFLVDGELKATDTVPNTGDWEVYTELKSTTSLYLTAGTHTIRLEPGDDTWNWNLDKMTLTPETGVPTTFEEEKWSVSIYPNPANNLINIELVGQKDVVSVNFYNAKGVLVKSVGIEGDRMAIAVDDLESGIYFVLIKSTDSVIAEKLIID